MTRKFLWLSLGVSLAFGAAVNLSASGKRRPASDSASPLFNSPQAASRAEYCERSKNPDYFKTILLNPRNRLAFPNEEGWLNTGLCWWHSLLQRAAAHLIVFRPEYPKPDRWEALALIEDLVTQKGVVEIPGYTNLRDFSSDYRRELVRALSAVEITSSIFELGFIKGLLGTPHQQSGRLRQLMDELHDEVEVRKRIAFQVLQMPGPDAHAWLVLGMLPVKREEKIIGYDIVHIDSNDLEIRTQRYIEGEPLFVYFERWNSDGNRYYDRFPMTPYTYKSGELRWMRHLRDEYCTNGTTSVDRRAQPGSGGA